MLTYAQILLAAYGVLLIAGGIIGKLRADSTPSLVAGSLCGLASFYALWLTFTNPILGLLIGTMLSLLLIGIFASRTFRTRKLMPSGLVLIVSIVMAIVLVLIRNELLSGVLLESVPV